MPGPETPRISLVIPNYWDADLIRETLQSVCESEPIEVVVVDDATPDTSVQDKLRGYEREGLIDTLVCKQRNGGVAAAVTDGVRVARGRFVFLLGNDDLLLPGVLGQLADALEADTGAAFAVGGFQAFGSRDRRYIPPPWDPWRALHRNYWTGAMMLRRDSFLELGSMDGRSGFEDWALYLALADHGHRGVVLPIVAYRYRIHGKQRLWKTARRSWGRQYRILRESYPELFAQARELRRQSPASRFVKFTLPILTKWRAMRPAFISELVELAGEFVTRMRRAFRRGTSADRVIGGGDAA